LLVLIGGGLLIFTMDKKYHFIKKTALFLKGRFNKNKPPENTVLPPKSPPADV
jgi:hypothetical protein